MPRPRWEVIIIGEQLPELDVIDMARLIIQFARQRQAKLAESADSLPAEPEAGEAA